MRGGSWNNNPQNLRSANRNNNQPDNRNNNIGFRLARTLIRQNRHDHGLVSKESLAPPRPGRAQGGVCGTRCVHLMSWAAQRAFRAVHDDTAGPRGSATTAPVLGPLRPTGAAGHSGSRAMLPNTFEPRFKDLASRPIGARGSVGARW
ncbi:MAG: SUMF1/EgtB/PvdO family nonheme iron enzyme [Hyphomicrobiaceae bacterium]